MMDVFFDSLVIRMLLLLRLPTTRESSLTLRPEHCGFLSYPPKDYDIPSRCIMLALGI